LVEKPKGKRPLRRQDVGGWKILKWNLERYEGMVWIVLIWFRIGISWGLLWTRYWTFGFHKMLEVLELLHNSRLLKKGSAPWVSK
jgi:hypothetical protein